MAKISKLQKSSPQNPSKAANTSKTLDDYLGKYFWLIIPILSILYYLYHFLSPGFYQDDEIAQYINMLQFWKDPWVILGNGPKPGYKIFMVIPALFGYEYVLMINAFIAAITVYLTYVLIKSYGIGLAAAGALLLASQPLFIELSFRSYSEIFTAMCLVAVLILYKKEKYFLSALFCGYIYTIRQEIALLILVLAVVFIRKKDFVPAIALFIFPFVYDLLGFIKTGDPLFILTEMKSVAGLNYKSQGLMHYFKVYIFIVGPVGMTLFLTGFFGFLNKPDKYKDYIKSYFLFYVIFLSVFVTQILTMVNDGPNPGNWRYLLHLSPICAFFSVVGLHNLYEKRSRKTNVFIMGTFAVLVLLFLSKTSDGFILLEKSDFTKLFFVTAVLALSIMLWKDSKRIFLNRISVAAIILSVVYFAYSNEPKKLSPENITVKETANFIDNIQQVADREKLVNHTVVLFYSESFKTNQELYKRLNTQTLSSAPKGSLIIWESHYGYRPEFQNDVKFESLQNDSSYKLLGQFVSSDRRFYSFIFEKL